MLIIAAGQLLDGDYVRRKYCASEETGRAFREDWKGCWTSPWFASLAQGKVLLHIAEVSLIISNTVKDNFNIPGKPSSVGFTNWALEPMKEESTIVGVLRDLGAVQYVKTNVPTAMMIAESVNNTYGR